MLSNFDDELQEVVKIARWAPSSHNSQPWTVIHVRDPGHARSIFGEELQSGDHCVVLALNSTRKLKALKSLEIEMLMSCGAFLGLFCMSLGLRGHDWSLTWIDGNVKVPAVAELEQNHNCLALAAIRISPGSIAPQADPEYWNQLVLQRRTHRGLYTSRRMTNETLQRLLVSHWPTSLTGKHTLIHVERNTSEIRRTAQLVKKYAELDFANYKAWKETYRYIHFSPSKKAEDGFYLQSLLGPQGGWSRLFYRCFLAPPMMQLLRPFGAAKRIANQLGALVESSPQLLFCHLDAEHMTPKTLIQAGARLMEVWINAQEQKLAIHPVSVVLQHDHARASMERLRDERGRMVFFARIGSAKDVFPNSPRRKTENIITTG